MTTFAGRPVISGPIVPQPPSSYNRGYMSQLIDVISREIARCLKSSVAAPRVLLLSPGAKVFALTVDDTGLLTVAEVPQADATV